MIETEKIVAKICDKTQEIERLKIIVMMRKRLVRLRSEQILVAHQRGNNSLEYLEYSIRIKEVEALIETIYLNQY